LALANTASQVSGIALIGATVRIDSTVTAALMHEPSDSALLWDAVRHLCQLERQSYGISLAERLKRPPMPQPR
jgi:hypothetical protein